MTVTLSALGHLKDTLPETRNFSLEDTASHPVGSTVLGLLNLHHEERHIIFVVNGMVRKDSYNLKDGDHVKIMKLMGAG